MKRIIVVNHNEKLMTTELSKDSCNAAGCSKSCRKQAEAYLATNPDPNIQIMRFSSSESATNFELDLSNNYGFAKWDVVTGYKDMLVAKIKGELSLLNNEDSELHKLIEKLIEL